MRFVLKPFATSRSAIETLRRTGSAATRGAKQVLNLVRKYQEKKLIQCELWFRSGGCNLGHSAWLLPLPTAFPSHNPFTMHSRGLEHASDELITTRLFTTLSVALHMCLFLVPLHTCTKPQNHNTSQLFN